MYQKFISFLIVAFVIGLMAISHADEAVSRVGNHQALNAISKYIDWRFKLDATFHEIAEYPISYDGKEIVDKAQFNELINGKLKKLGDYFRKNIDYWEIKSMNFVPYSEKEFEANLVKHKKTLSIDYERVLAAASKLLNDGDLVVVMETDLHRKQSDGVESGSYWVMLSRSGDGYKIRGFQVS